MYCWLRGKRIEREEENFLFSVVEVTSPKKRERERLREREKSTSGVRLKFVAVRRQS
jgi:hypothetical protein